MHSYVMCGVRMLTGALVHVFSSILYVRMYVVYYEYCESEWLVNQRALADKDTTYLATSTG